MSGFNCIYFKFWEQEKGTTFPPIGRLRLSSPIPIIQIPVPREHGGFDVWEFQRALDWDGSYDVPYTLHRSPR